MFHHLDSTIENILNDSKAPTELVNAGVSFETPDKSFKPKNPGTSFNRAGM
jgi:hypothetical protein